MVLHTGIVINAQFKYIAGVQQRRRLGKNDSLCGIHLYSIAPVICAIIPAGDYNISRPVKVVNIILSGIAFYFMNILCYIRLKIYSLCSAVIDNIAVKSIAVVHSGFAVTRIAVTFCI